MKEKMKKIFSLEFYEDILVRIFRFFMHRNPLVVYFWLKYYLFDGAFRKDKENKKIFHNKYRSFNQKHPYISAGTSFVLILAFVFSSVWWLVLRSPEPAAAWWDDTWGYRRALNLSNSTSEDITNFPVEFTVDTATLVSEGKMQSDCDDIRITDVNGNLLDYDYENCNNASTTIIFELPRIDAGMNATAYFYYGKSTASQGNNKKTIASRIINGDFSSSDWTGWTSTPATDGGTTEFWIDDWPDDGSCVTPSGTNDNPCGYGAGRIEVLSVAEGDAVCAPGSGCPTPVVGDGTSLTLGGGGTAYNGNIYSDSYEVPGGVYIHWWHNLQGRSSDAGRYSTATRWYGTPQAYTVTEGEGPAWALVKDGNKDNDIGDSDEIISWDAWGAEDGGATTSQNEQKIIDVRSYSGEYVKVYIESSHGGGGDDSLIQIDDLYWADSAGNEIDLLSSTGSEEKSKGPVGYWSFDEGYGTTANDGSSNNNNGTISGATWQMEDQCVVGKCLSFNGSNSVVNFSGSSQNYNTFSAWFITTSTDEQVIGAGFLGSTYYALVLQDSKLTIAGSGGAEEKVKTINTYNTNQWYHVAVVRTEESYPNEFIIYVNGEEQEIEAGGSHRASGGAYIGARYYSGSYSVFFKGKIDDVRVYNYIRSADEIKQNYNAGLAGMSNPKGASVTAGSESPAWMSDGLVGHWKMNEDGYDSENNLVLDSSGNENHGEGVYLNLAADKLGRNNGAIKLEANKEDLLMDYRIWEDGQTGSVGNFTAIYGTDSRVIAEDPWGRKVVVWQAGASGDVTYPAQGGIYHSAQSIDNTKLYRMSWWEKRVTNANATYGRYYAGLNGYGSTAGVLRRDTGANETNPYFWNSSNIPLETQLPVGQWVLVVGHIWPAGSGIGEEHTDSGRYTLAGRLGDISRDYVFRAETTTTRSRTLSIYRGDDENIVHHTAYPRLDVVDGTEPSIEELLSGHDKYGDSIEINVEGNKESYAFWYDHNSDGSWEYVVNSSGTYYVDGELGMPTKDPIYISGDDVYIGREDMETYLDGTISDLRFYNRALSPEEVKGLYEYAPGPVGHWKMDEGSGTTAVDSSGNGNNGAITAATWEKGKYGSSLNFSSTSNTNVRGTISPAIIASGDYTQEAWIYATANVDGAIIDDYNNAEHYIMRNSTGTIKVNYYDNPGTPTHVFAQSTKTVPLNTWTHVAGVVESGDSIKVYVNGELWAENNSLSIESKILNDFSVGQWGGGSNKFDGLIDDVRIYNYARTPKQIVEDMNAGHPIGGSPVGSQVSYWKFDEGFGTTAYDSITASGNDGTISGASWTNDGKFGKALNFGGGVESGDYISLGSSYQIDLTSATISFWAKRNVFATTQDTTNTNGALRVFEGGAYYKFIDQLVNDQYFQFSAERDTNSEYWASFTSSVEVDTEWHHFIITADDNVFKLYIDGEYQGTDDDSSASNTSNTCTITNIGKGFGAGSSTYGSFYDGYIDEVKFYDYPLSENEIKKDYNQGKSLVMGTSGTASDGTTPSNASSRTYCVPGDVSTCNPPVAEWKFDEGTGTTAYDTSGNGNNSDAFGGDPAWGNGKYGAALNFDTNDYTRNNNFSMGSDPVFTVSGWFKKTGNMNAKGAWGIGAGGTSSQTISGYNNVGEKIGIDLWGTSTYYTDKEYPSNEWIHIAWVKNATDFNTDTIEIYVDGKKEDLSVSRDGSDAVSLSSGFTVGGIYASSSYNAPVIVDDFKIYNYARTPAQIAWDYNRGKPVGWWRMDEGEGTTVYDHSGNGNNGTMTNMFSDDWVDGKINTALDFDGVDDYVSHSDISFSDASPNSYSAWVRWDGAKPPLESFILPFGSIGGGTIYLYTNGIYYFKYRCDGCDSGAGEISGSDTETLFDGNWHLISWTVDNSRNVSVYIDGNLNASDTITDTSMQYGDIGNGYSTNSYFWNGQIDDVRVFNYALTPLQIKEIYNGGAVNYR